MPRLLVYTHTPTDAECILVAGGAHGPAPRAGDVLVKWTALVVKDERFEWVAPTTLVLGPQD